MTPLQKKELKRFKLRVKLEAENALQIGHDHEVMIDTMACVFYPLNQKEINKATRNFKTTKWW